MNKVTYGIIFFLASSLVYAGSQNTEILYRYSGVT